MIVRRRSQLSGEWNEMDLPTTQGKVHQWERWQRAPGTPHVQDHFTELSAEQREFMLTGITPSEWASTFPECPHCGAYLGDCERGCPSWYE